MIIGTLGPEGSFTEKAAKQWNDKAELRYYSDIMETVDALTGGEVDYSIVPIENSQDGSITITLDLLMEQELQIVGEIIVQIRHCLLSKGRSGDIKVIASHPSALAQCRKFIKKNFKNIEVRSTLSTSQAAKLACESKDIAAIASRESAHRYGLDILAEDIQDMNENYTRFIVIGKNIPPATGNDKTSIIVYLEKNRPGALYEILGEFADAGIDLTKIESRPTKKILGDYLFHIDLKGHIEEGIIRDTLGRIRSKIGIKILGSYPAAR
ncbi:prephenate dehydratase [Candidatus Methanoperedens nitroreducens]|uniref:prephenate dehydratase n=1 Tax=Candidatus Methanoperedens nitratireducens TaxID=1392998 RepID=A0A062UWW4_9EURY|nr:prephenate dehydratase [Candidatus Methanoperedens nitroreducens]KCZ71481.1 prephenate dehydratase [Candidatus Methanoperedens nitroreducens]MDJ1421110.1 prephenate dehydratase [Candidatus Methanoperedens sp.]